MAQGNHKDGLFSLKSSSPFYVHQHGAIVTVARERIGAGYRLASMEFEDSRTSECGRHLPEYVFYIPHQVTGICVKAGVYLKKV